MTEHPLVAAQTYTGKARSHGFRLSLSDVFVLVSGFMGTWWTVTHIGEFGYIIAFVVFHFFLFCNVFRIRRKPELIWAILFLSNVGLTTVLLLASIWLSFGLQMICTGVIILYDMRDPGYHGILARRLNPHLDDYLQGRIRPHPTARSDSHQKLM